jgi:hypothetical protein
MVCRALVFVRDQQRVLGAGDLGQHLGARRLAVVGQRPLDLAALGVGEQPVDHPAHVPLVVDRVSLGAPEHARVLAQQPRAHRMERRRHHGTRDGLSQQVGEPQPQLRGGANAECDREDLPRLGAAAREQIRRTVGQRPGLAGARAGQQQQRAGTEGDGLRLFGGQSREQPLGLGRRVIAQARVGLGHMCLLQ